VNFACTYVPSTEQYSALILVPKPAKACQVPIVSHEIHKSCANTNKFGLHMQAASDAVYHFLDQAIINTSEATSDYLSVQV